jgi:hypothetical protein
MKTRTILVFIISIAIGVTVMLWRKPASAPAPVAVSKPAVSVGPFPAASPVHPPEEQAQLGRRIQAAARSVPPVPNEESDRLAIEIQQAFASTNLETREFALTNLLPALVQIDAPVAASLIERITAAGDLREAALRQVAQNWSAQNPSAALAWAAALIDTTEREAALTDVCLQVARENPAEAIQMRAQYAPDNSPNPALENLAQQWAGKDFSAALAWTLAHPPGEQRDQMIARVAFVQAQTAPLEAANLVVDQMSPGPAQTEAVMSVLHQWGLQDLPAATAWAEQFPEGPVRDRAILELAGIRNALRQANQP